MHPIARDNLVMTFCPVTGGVCYIGGASRGPLSFALSMLEFDIYFATQIVRFESRPGVIPGAQRTTTFRSAGLILLCKQGSLVSRVAKGRLMS